MDHLYSTTFEIMPGGNLQPQKPKDTEASNGVQHAVVPFISTSDEHVISRLHVWLNYKITVNLFLFRFHFQLILNIFPGAKEAGTDNRNIVDDGKSQKLTKDDIELLKEQGLKGQVQQSAWNYIHTVVVMLNSMERPKPTMNIPLKKVVRCSV